MQRGSDGKRWEMNLDSKRNIGNAGLSLAIAYFGAHGHTVSIPLNDTQEYDLIVDIGGKLNKVQVKTTNCVNENGSYLVSLRSISGTTRKAYKTVKDTNVDILFCVCGDGTMYSIPKSAVKNTSVMSLRKEKSKYSCAEQDYSRFIVNF